MASISRQFAQWVSKLRYEDLPPAVIDRAKGVTLQAMASVLIGAQTASGKQALAMIADEEAGVKKGATLMVDGTLVTKGGAAYANSETALSGGKYDTFRMLTHPNTAIIPAALVAAESTGASGKTFLTGVVAGYEVMERMAAEFIPQTMSQGFHPGPVFGIFGAAVAAAKIMGLNEEQLNSTIALCASLASGNLESARGGGKALREGAATRSALLAVTLAQGGHTSADSVLEGEAGFYHAYCGNNRGILNYSFVGDVKANLDAITANLGKEWMFLETLYRIYYTAGYNIAHIDVPAAICNDNNLKLEDIERVEAVVNWMETQYPSPAYPSRREDGDARIGGTAYFTAYGVVKRGYPVTAGQQIKEADAPPDVVDFMKRVTIIPSHKMTLFGPRFTIFTKSGKSYTRQSTGREFIWDFDTHAKRISGIAGSLPIPAAQYEQIVAACRGLENEARADKLVKLTLKP
ncbi:MAG: MmgE/PrpD family protein [Betaproteobacteria bacterium]|nr:MmgE/PrpD family protein [Betaproteobacteria bacterium]